MHEDAFLLDSTAVFCRKKCQLGVRNWSKCVRSQFWIPRHESWQVYTSVISLFDPLRQFKDMHIHGSSWKIVASFSMREKYIKLFVIKFLVRTAQALMTVQANTNTNLKTFGAALSCSVAGRTVLSEEIFVTVLAIWNWILSVTNSSNDFPGNCFVQYKIIIDRPFPNYR